MKFHNIFRDTAATMEGMIQSGIFEDLQRKIDEDTAIKDVNRHVYQGMDRTDHC